MYKLLKKLITIVMCICIIMVVTSCSEKVDVKVDEEGNIEQSLSALNLEVDEQVSNFKCNLLDGSVFDSSKSKKPLLVFFWATW